MIRVGSNDLNSRTTIQSSGKEYTIYSIPTLAKSRGDLSKLPYTLKILLENLLRYQDGDSVNEADIDAIVERAQGKGKGHEIAYRPTRVLMQDFTGVPAVADLAAMRDAIVKRGKSAKVVNPLSPVDLVIDHSVMIDYSGNNGAFEKNVELEFQRNRERYEFLRWGQKAFDNFRVVPPGTGICHQINLEYLARTIWSDEDQDGRLTAFPDSLVGTDSHTTMINGLGVLGWGVGGIEAEAAMLGQPISMLIPEVIGFELTGKLCEGRTATDLVLTVTQMLRAYGVVEKCVEFFGDGLSHLTLADRATLANMAPEYGATCGLFPIDEELLAYLRLTARPPEVVQLVEDYAKIQGMWREDGAAPAVYSDTLGLDISRVEASLAGPKRPQDRVSLSGVSDAIKPLFSGNGKAVPVKGKDYTIEDGSVIIAAITSCTNTSNPNVLVAAGLVARKAHKLGLTARPWVKTSLAPGSQVVTDYLESANLMHDLEALGFHLAGYGCTTCIGNSGPIEATIADAIDEGDIVAASVLSGNRNFEGRISPQARANFLASPPLVVAYALAGTVCINLETDPLSHTADGKPVFLSDIWPTTKEIEDLVHDNISPTMFETRYGHVFDGPVVWQNLENPEGDTYDWNSVSTYVQKPPFFDHDLAIEPGNLEGARSLLILGDSVTTDHISPAGAFAKETPAGKFLTDRKVQPKEFNSYGSRRGNHEIMMRGTFANIRIRNELAPKTEGGFTQHAPSGESMTVYDAAMRYAEEDVPLLVFGGKEYGTGSSRDWAAKGTRLLGVRAVIAESFERIHRSNLIGMGVLPLEFTDGKSRKTLKLTGEETFDLAGVTTMTPRSELTLVIKQPDGSTDTANLRCRIDTEVELRYFRSGGILHFVLNELERAA